MFPSGRCSTPVVNSRALEGRNARSGMKNRKCISTRIIINYQPNLVWRYMKELDVSERHNTKKARSTKFSACAVSFSGAKVEKSSNTKQKKRKNISVAKQARVRHLLQVGTSMLSKQLMRQTFLQRLPT